jgi:hypothetical protein
MLDSLKPISLPSSFSNEEVGRRIYPEAYAAKTPVEVMNAYALISREKHHIAGNLAVEVTRVEDGRVLLSESRVRILTRQHKILENLCAELHERASQTYFAVKGWPFAHLDDERVPEAYTWHFFYEYDFAKAYLKRIPTANEFSVANARSGHARYIKALAGVGFAIRHAPDQSKIRFREYQLCGPARASEFEGHVSELQDWALENRLLYMKLDAADVVEYLESKPTTAWLDSQWGPAYRPRKPFHLGLVFSEMH